VIAGEEPDVELGTHLEGCADCRGRLDRLEREVESTRTLARSERPEEQAGAPFPPSLGKFFVIGVLDEDDEVVTYRGVHADLDQEVAIHVARSPLPDDPAEHRAFVNACRQLDRLDGSWVARVLELNEWEGRPYLAMEYVPGTGVSAGPFRPEEVAQKGAHLARGLASAHRLGITHGPFTPRSIAVDDAGQFRIVDFGVNLLRAGARGEIRTAVDPAADVAELARSLAELLGEQAEASALRSVLTRAQASGAAARFANADDFAAALERASGPRAWRTWLVGAAVVLLAALAALAWLLRLDGR
jgi:hypothetical protein